MAAEIEKTIERLEDNPRCGPDGRVVGSRELRVLRTPYLLAYRIKGETVLILRLFHEKQRWPTRF